MGKQFEVLIFKYFIELVFLLIEFVRKNRIIERKKSNFLKM